MSIKNKNFNKGPALRLSKGFTPTPTLQQHKVGVSLQSKRGFTLIEIMIAITLFTAIMIIGTGAVLQTNSVYKKTQTMRSVMDNLNFIMEDMVRNLRLGSSYHCPSVAGVCII